MKILSAVPWRKYAAWVIFGLIVAGPSSHQAQSQQVTPSFKITGEKKMEVYPGSVNQRAVEYDPYNSDHLILSYYGKGILLQKGQFRFKGKKFNLASFQSYLSNKELLKDGIHQIFTNEQVLTTEMIYKDDTLREQTLFYPNGQKQMTFAGDEKALNGAFTMWHPNGQISFLGRYKNNLKDGEFESFDETGQSERKGTYREGKLISGQSVVQDLLYDVPEVPAQFPGGEEAFYDYLKTRTENLPAVKEIKDSVVYYLSLFITIDKLGNLKKMEITPDLSPSAIGVVNTAFRKFPGFKPALMEGAPVRSLIKHELFLSNKGLETIIQNTDSLDKNENISNYDGVYFIVEEMPEFPGGEEGLRMFIAKTVRYPIEAQEAGIMGKPIVSFIIREDGKVVSPAIVRSAHSLLDAEAIRVVQHLPRWKPGRQGGKAVRVSYTMPINFVLK